MCSSIRNVCPRCRSRYIRFLLILRASGTYILQYGQYRRPLWELCHEPKFEGKCSGLDSEKILEGVNLFLSWLANGFSRRKTWRRGDLFKTVLLFYRPLQTSFISPPFHTVKRTAFLYFPFELLVGLGVGGEICDLVHDIDSDTGTTMCSIHHAPTPK
jgi:hypothetical protein